MLALAERKKRLGDPVRQGRNHNGLTLIEMMVVVAVTLIFMLALTRVFSILGDSVNSGRSMIELNGNIRSISQRIQRDLNGVTVPLDPPIDLSRGAGYFEYLEGPASDKDINKDGITDATRPSFANFDTRLGDRDDVLMFTARSEGAPFVGRIPGGTIESQVAEIIYWLAAVDLNGDNVAQANEWNLYRRVLLVQPEFENNNQINLSAAPIGLEFFANYDISARLEDGRMMANSLADLTKRENRFARTATPAPYSVDATQVIPFPPGSSRQGEDVLLSGVLAFDIRAFDPTASIISRVEGTGVQILSPGDPGWDPNVGQVIATGAYVDLNYYTDGLSTFSGPAHPKSGLVPTPIAKSTYDTWSFHYEHDGLDNNGNDSIDEGIDGIDDNGVHGADDLMERETSPPYLVRLRGIQILVRLYEPSSQAVKQATITANFVE
jgi:prepilin-type N-terminal cleavage/methylation domain-containing protein